MGGWVTAAYGRRTWKQLLYVLVCAPLSYFEFGYVLVAVGVFGVFSIISLGIPLLAAGVLGARLFGGLHRWLAGTLLGQQTEPPPRIRPAPGPLGWIRSGLTDATGWRTLLYLFARLPLTVLEVGVGFACWWYGVYFVTLPLSWRALPTTASYSSQAWIPSGFAWTTSESGSDILPLMGL
jgi:hypothetical protein